MKAAAELLGVTTIGIGAEKMRIGVETIGIGAETIHRWWNFRQREVARAIFPPCFAGSTSLAHAVPTITSWSPPDPACRRCAGSSNVTPSETPCLGNPCPRSSHRV